MAHVFVYGTLMRGGANHAVLERLRARLVAAARTVGGRTLVDLGPYPALLPHDEQRDAVAPNVHGEVYEVDERGLKALDAFEGCPDLYRREPVRLTTDAGPLDADVYVFAQRPPSRARVVSTGRYERIGDMLIERARPSDFSGD